MIDWAEVFLPTTPIVEVVVRGTVMFLAIFILLRVVGQREGGVHSLTDLLVVVLIAEAAAHGMAGNASGVGDSLVLIATILAWSLALDAVAYRWPALGTIIKSRPKPLVVDGRINQRALRNELMSRDELMAELRLRGITEIAEVARAYLEPNGMVSVIRSDAGEPEDRPEPRAAG